MTLQDIPDFVIGTEVRDEISEAILSVKVSLTMQMVSEITATFSDPGLRFLEANYFQLRQQVKYRGMLFEISTVETGMADANEQVVIQCRNQKTQFMKRDKGQSSYGNISPTQYAAARAAEFGLNFFGEPSAGKNEIVRTRNDTSDESTWDVLKRLAGELKFELFETDGRLFFTSQTFLLNKYGASPVPILKYPSFEVGTRKVFSVFELPNCRRSDDSPLDAVATVKVDRLNGQLLRPGMTVKIGGVHTFNLPYLVKEVSWEEGELEPISVSLQTPVDEKKNLKVI